VPPPPSPSSRWGDSVRSVVRVALYTPTGVAGGRRVAGADEDAFTLGATAVERVLPDEGQFEGPVPVHLLGDFPQVADWGFAALLGRAAEVERHPGTSTALAKVLRSAEEGNGGSALVVAVDLPERAHGSPEAEPSPLGAASVAFLLTPDSASSRVSLGKVAAGRSAVAAALLYGARHRDRERGGSVTFVGDWDAAPEVGPSVDLVSVQRAADRETNAVSEGAYVPKPRYLENLPSRWRFVAERCGACNEVTFPARGSCRRCGRPDALNAHSLPRDGGTILAVTTIRKGGQPTEFDAQVDASGPYDVALVELAPGARVTLQVTDSAPGSVHVGDSVVTRLRRLYPMEGEWRYGRKALASLREPG